MTGDDCWFCFTVALIVIVATVYVGWDWIKRGQPW
jgi:hypothetical protein